MPGYWRYDLIRFDEGHCFTILFNSIWITILGLWFDSNHDTGFAIWSDSGYWLQQFNSQYGFTIQLDLNKFAVLAS